MGRKWLEGTAPQHIRLIQEHHLVIKCFNELLRGRISQVLFICHRCVLYPTFCLLCECRKLDLSRALPSCQQPYILWQSQLKRSDETSILKYIHILTYPLRPPTLFVGHLRFSFLQSTARTTYLYLENNHLRLLPWHIAGIAVLQLNFNRPSLGAYNMGVIRIARWHWLSVNLVLRRDKGG